MNDNNGKDKNGKDILVTEEIVEVFNYSLLSLINSIF